MAKVAAAAGLGLRDLAGAMRRFAGHPTADGFVGIVAMAWSGLIEAAPDVLFLFAFALATLVFLDAGFGMVRANQEGKFRFRSLAVLTWDKVLRYAGLLLVAGVAGFYADIADYSVHRDPNVVYRAKWVIDFLLGATVGLSARELGSTLQHADAVFDGKLRDLLKPARGVLVMLERLRDRDVVSTTWDPVRQSRKSKVKAGKGTKTDGTAGC